MREDLLCYALGELDEQATRKLELELERSAELRRELDEIRRCLAGQDDRPAGSPIECPRHLADRTAEHIAATCGASRAEAHRTTEASSTCTLAAFVRRTPITLVDSMVAIGVMMVMASLVLPAINSSRSVADRLNCQNNLRELWTYLQTFAENNNDYYPVVGPDDNAGSYTMQLTSAGVVSRDRLQQLVDCPGGKRATATTRTASLPAYIPTMCELQQADPLRRAQLNCQMGGRLGYRVGFVQNGRYYPIRDTKNCRVALLGDTPRMAPDGYHSTNHDGGQNVLWQGGNVSFETSSLVSGINDHLYLNDRGLPSAGLNWRDAVLAPSHATPGISRETTPAKVFFRLRIRVQPTPEVDPNFVRP